MPLGELSPALLSAIKSILVHGQWMYHDEREEEPDPASVLDLVKTSIFVFNSRRMALSMYAIRRLIHVGRPVEHNLRGTGAIEVNSGSLL